MTAFEPGQGVSVWTEGEWYAGAEFQEYLTRDEPDPAVRVRIRTGEAAWVTRESQVRSGTLAWHDEPPKLLPAGASGRPAVSCAEEAPVPRTNYIAACTEAVAAHYAAMARKRELRELSDAPPRSRVHELASMRFTDLITLYGQMATRAGIGLSVQSWVTSRGFDSVIAAIRNIEDVRDYPAG